MPSCRHSKAAGSTVSSYLIPSRMSLGTISTINTLAVINTVLRQPIARKGSGPTWSGGRCSAGYPHSPFFSCHFVPVLTPKMVAGLWLAMWERRTNWQGRGRSRGGLWDWGGRLLFFILLVGASLGYQDRGKRGGETERGMIVRSLPYMLHTQKRTSVHGQTKSRTRSHAVARKNKVLIQCGCETQHPVMVTVRFVVKKTYNLHVLNICGTLTNTHVAMHEHTHKQVTQPFSWYGLPLSMQMTFIMQMHTNQNQPSENPGWEKNEKNTIKWARGTAWKIKKRGWKCEWTKYSVTLRCKKKKKIQFIKFWFLVP